MRCHKRESANRRATIKPEQGQTGVWAQSATTRQAQLEQQRGLATLKSTIPGNLYPATPKPVRRRHRQQQISTHLGPNTCHPTPPWRSQFLSILRPIQRVRHHPGECRSIAQGNAHRGLLAGLSQLCHTPSCMSYVCRAEHTELTSHILIHLSELPHKADLEPHQRSLAAETSHGQ